MSSASSDSTSVDSPQPKTSGAPPVEVTDPRALRALAHPARITLRVGTYLEFTPWFDPQDSTD